MFFRISLYLLALNFFAENFGYLTHQLYQFLGIACVSFYGFSAVPLGRKTKKRGLFLAGCMLCLISLLFFSGSIPFRLAGTAVFLLAMKLFLKSKNDEEKEIPLLLCTTTLYFYSMLLHLYSPPFWYGMNKMALAFSTFESTISGVPILFSSTFLGVPITSLVFIFTLTLFFSSGRKKPFLLILSLIAMVIVNGCYLMVIHALPLWAKSVIKLFTDQNNFIRFFLGFLFEKDYPLTCYNYQMNAPVVLFVLYLIPLSLIFWKRNLGTIGAMVTQGTVQYSLALLLTTTLATSFLTIDLPGKHSEKKEVVFYNKGYLNWEIPSFKMFGSKSAGMFGNLPPFLEAMGFTTKRVDMLSKEVLDDSKILVMINIDNELPTGEREVIWRFVEEGGSLLLLGDHTFYKHGLKRIILNDILEPYHIRFNFDSADWFVGGWLHSYQYLSHPITVGMRDEMNDVGIVIGASLTVTPPAFPLVIGKYGYSDPGNEQAGGERGYLGNLDYNPGEQMGEVVLCGAEHYGKGKVLVFGDTSSFANAILVNSYDFVNRVFTWLAKDESPKRYRLTLLISLTLFLAAIFFYTRSTRTTLLLVLSLMVALITIKVAEHLKQYHNQRELNGTIAYLDMSHGERFSPESWNENATLGLALNLMRNGYLPFSLGSFDERRLDQAKLLILIAPSSPFEKHEINEIRDFVERGGIVMITVGWEEREASVSLLASFGFSLDYLPLAQFISIIPYANQKVKFFEAWPVLSTDEKGEVIAAYQQFPVVMKKSYGKGQVVLIGDSSFFWNVNLEMEESYTSENIQFLQWLLESLKNRSTT